MNTRILGMDLSVFVILQNMEHSKITYRDRLLDAASKGYLDGSVCPYCNQKTELIDSSEIYHGISYGFMYICKSCKAYVGCYKNSQRSLGRLANEELRLAKHTAHQHFDRIWKSKEMSGWYQKKAYRWLSEQLDTPLEYTHIGMFEIDMCEKVVELSDKLLKEKGIQI